MRDFASVNPVSKVVEAIRQGFIADATWAKTWPAVVTVIGLLSVTASLAVWQMQRMGR